MSLIVTKFGANIDGHLMGVFYVPSKRKAVYFLWDIVTGLIVECDENGRKLAGKVWLDKSPHQFVVMHWGGHVSGFGKIHIFGHPLTSFKREYYPRNVPVDCM